MIEKNKVLARIVYGCYERHVQILETLPTENNFNIIWCEKLSSIPMELENLPNIDFQNHPIALGTVSHNTYIPNNIDFRYAYFLFQSNCFRIITMTLYHLFLTEKSQINDEQKTLEFKISKNFISIPITEDMKKSNDLIHAIVLIMISHFEKFIPELELRPASSTEFISEMKNFIYKTKTPRTKSIGAYLSKSIGKQCKLHEIIERHTKQTEDVLIGTIFTKEILQIDKPIKSKDNKLKPIAKLKRKIYRNENVDLTKAAIKDMFYGNDIQPIGLTFTSYYPTECFISELYHKQPESPISIYGGEWELIHENFDDPNTDKFAQYKRLSLFTYKGCKTIDEYIKLHPISVKKPNLSPTENIKIPIVDKPITKMKTKKRNINEIKDLKQALSAGMDYYTILCQIKPKDIDLQNQIWDTIVALMKHGVDL